VPRHFALLTRCIAFGCFIEGVASDSYRLGDLVPIQG